MNGIRIIRLTVISALGALTSVACGGKDCEESLACAKIADITLMQDSGANDEAAAGSSGTSTGEADAGSEGGAGGGGSIVTGQAGGAADAGQDAGGQAPEVCGVNPVMGCVASAARTVFVSAAVDESGDGSSSEPVKTIAEGIERARAADATRIVVCNGVYPERVLLSVEDSGRSLVGGYNCDSWIYNPEGETLVRPTDRGYALEIAGTTARIVVSNFTFDAAAAIDPGESSIAAFVHEASDVRFKQVRLIAHGGQPAPLGVTHEFAEGALDEWPAQASLNGQDGLGSTPASAPLFVGGSQTEVTCPGGLISRSGAGGSKPNMDAGQSGQLPLSKGGAGGALTSTCDTCVSGICECVSPAMANGMPGDFGLSASGAAQLGSISAQGWEPQAGLLGEIGGPGGGGGGGDGTYQSCGQGGDVAWYGGGGGAAGGCGGNGGAAGTGGGASIALIVLDSAVLLTSCEVSTQDAGGGGNGAEGQLGQAGGVGGAGVTATSYSLPCAGGDGGNGGAGGPGGGGAGGVSAGVVWAGDFEPVVDSETQFTLGLPGVGGIGGDPGNNDGIEGLAENILEVPAG